MECNELVSTQDGSCAVLLAAHASLGCCKCSPTDLLRCLAAGGPTISRHRGRTKRAHATHPTGNMLPVPLEGSQQCECETGFDGSEASNSLPQWLCHPAQCLPPAAICMALTCKLHCPLSWPRWILCKSWTWASSTWPGEQYLAPGSKLVHSPA